MSWSEGLKAKHSPYASLWSRNNMKSKGGRPDARFFTRTDTSSSWGMILSQVCFLFVAVWFRGCLLTSQQEEMC
jgi:hypothetical protein